MQPIPRCAPLRRLVKRGVVRFMLALPDRLLHRMGRLWLAHIPPERAAAFGGPLLADWLDRLSSQEPQQTLIDLLRVSDETMARIDQAAIRLDGGVHAKHRLMRYPDFFVERIRATDRVLDVGCGNGAVAYAIATRSGASVMAIDLRPANIEQALSRHAHPSIQYVVGDATVTIPQGRVDVVVLSNVLEHIDDRQAFLRKLVATVRPQRLLLRIPMIDRHWLVPLRRELGLTYMSDSEHFTEYTLPAFLAELRQAGLIATHHQVNWGEIWAEAVPGE